ncbi:RteC domain-containing protein [Mucilaginibacter sp. Mucisp84]|uniref:RteC domain-containing protein n=1 Tax=Mucilaginibacter sp. Mucisp84 TaxID=3243058 RepID=UPI0039A51360
MNIEEKFAAFKEDVIAYNDLGTTPVRRLTGVLAAVRQAMDELKAWVITDPFSGTTDEIRFFKRDKPRFYAEQLYALEIFTIETNKPVGDDSLEKAYYEQELRFIRRFFDQHRFMYQYFLVDATELDHLLFVRGARPADVVLPGLLDADPVFTTAADFIFARFMAMERVQSWLMDQLYGRIDNKLLDLNKKGNSLQWTGSKTNLVELAYAIYGTKQLNNGDIEIADIITWLESTLSIDLGRYYQTFSEIKSRKLVGPTAYIDHMKEMLVRHLEEGDAFKPKQFRRR